MNDSIVAACLAASAVVACVVFWKKPEPEFISGFTSKYPMPERRHVTEEGLMNNHQRKVIIAALAVIGFVLFYAMASTDYDTRSSYLNTLIWDWGGTGKRYVHITHGLVGIFLGLVIPLLCWAAAIYLALGASRFGTTHTK